MSQTNFRDIFLDNILSFLWRQWSALGVLGGAKGEDPWIIDPEPLLVSTLEMARYEPRLFDEVIDWLVTNGEWIDMQRLRGILRYRENQDYRLVGAVSEFLASQGQERKWQNLVRFCFRNIPDELENLFKEKESRAQRLLAMIETDNIFAKYGFVRNVLKPSGKSREVIPGMQSTIRFLLRALFGVGSRAECILYLFTHDGGHPAEVAKAIGLSIRGTQDALIELSKSGFVLTRIRGKRKIEYWLSEERWWEFLSKGSIGEIKKPVWIDWIALYGALSKVWQAIDEIDETTSDYMRSSILRDAMEVVGNECARSGLAITLIPGRDVKPEDYEKVFKEFIMKVLGAE